MSCPRQTTTRAIQRERSETVVSIEQIIIATITLLARLSKLVYRRTPEEAFRSRSSARSSAWIPTSSCSC